MAPLYDGHEYYKKMLELQDKLRKSEEERIRLEERFSSLLLESRSRHDACINRLRLRYIEYLEDQRARDERNHRLLGALDRVDSSLALMTAKTDRLNTLRKQYEAHLLRAYASRPPGSVTGDSGIASQNEERRPRRENVAAPSNLTPRQIKFVPPSLSDRLDRLESIPRARQSNESLKIVPPDAQTAVVQSGANGASNGIFRKPKEFGYLDPSIRSASSRRDDVVSDSRYTSRPNYHDPARTDRANDLQGVTNEKYALSSDTIKGNETFRQPELSEFDRTRNASRYEPSVLLAYNQDCGPSIAFSDRLGLSPGIHSVPYRNASSDAPQSQMIDVPSSKFAVRSFDRSVPAASEYSRYLSFDPRGRPHLEQPLAIRDSCDSILNRNEPGLAKASSRENALDRTSGDVEAGERERTTRVLENELDRYIGKIKRLHRDLDAQSVEDPDHEQNTSGDLLNVTLSDDGLDLPAEGKVRDERASRDKVAREVEKVLALADELASSKIRASDEGVGEDSPNSPNSPSSRDSAKASVDEAHVESGKGAVERVPVLEGNRERREISLPRAEDRISDGVATRRAESRRPCENVDGFAKPVWNDARDARSPEVAEEKEIDETVQFHARPDDATSERVEEVRDVFTAKQAEIEPNDAEELESWNVEKSEKRIREVRVHDVGSEEIIQRESVVEDVAGNAGDSIGEERAKEEDVHEADIDIDTADNKDTLRRDVQDTTNVQNAEEVNTLDSRPESNTNGTTQSKDASQFQGENYGEEISDEQRQNREPDVDNEAFETDGQALNESQSERQEATSLEHQFEADVQDPNQLEQQVQEGYVYDQNVQYEDGKQQYEGYAGEGYVQQADGQYETYPSEQYEQYSNDPNAEFIQDPNVNYEQDPNVRYEQGENQQYVYDYDQQYTAKEFDENDPNQAYAYNENVDYNPDQTYDDAEKQTNAEEREYDDAEHQPRDESNEGVESTGRNESEESKEQVEEVQNTERSGESAEGVSEVGSESAANPEEPGPVEEASQPKKKKDVIKSLLDSDTDSTLERNVSNTESDFDFN